MVLLIGKIKFRIELELKSYKCDTAKDGSDYLEKIYLTFVKILSIINIGNDNSTNVVLPRIYENSHLLVKVQM